MFLQIGNWIELNFWQLAARALSTARPLSARALRAAHGLKAQYSIEARPLPRVFRSQWLIALSGWLLGLVLGYLYATR